MLCVIRDEIGVAQGMIWCEMIHGRGSNVREIGVGQGVQ